MARLEARPAFLGWVGRASRRAMPSTLLNPQKTSKNQKSNAPAPKIAPILTARIILSLAPAIRASISRKQNKIGMNGYFFTASATRSQVHPDGVAPGRTGCQSLIVCAGNAEEAQKRFEEWLCAQPEGEYPVRTQIHKIVAAQFIDQLLTEKESVPMDWPQIAKQAQTDLESIPVDDFEQGYWVDVNAVIGPSPSLEALRADLPEDVRSGLNWAEDKQSFFLLSVLTSAAAAARTRGGAGSRRCRCRATGRRNRRRVRFRPGRIRSRFPGTGGQGSRRLDSRAQFRRRRLALAQICRQYRTGRPSNPH